jgi:hypothetical protein
MGEDEGLLQVSRRSQVCWLRLGGRRRERHRDRVMRNNGIVV